MPLLAAAFPYVLSAIGGGLLTWSYTKGPDDEPISAEERKTARTKYTLGAIGAVMVWAFFKFRGKN